MAIMVVTAAPQALLTAVRKGIDDGTIDTWIYDGDGDFTHVTPDKQWEGKAWLRPSLQQGVLFFGLLGQQNAQMTKPVYGMFHGRFIAMLLTHFDTMFDTATATANATGNLDLFKFK